MTKKQRLTEITEFTNGGTERTEDERRRKWGSSQRDRSIAVRRRREATHTDEPDRDHERLCQPMPFMIPIRSVGVSRPASQAGRRTSPPFVLRYLRSSVCELRSLR